MEINSGIDPYEQQLLAVFESCDRGGTGRLDGEGLVTLCQKLHLEEGQEHLMGCLLSSGKAAFTFCEFRDALLALLGGGRRQSEEEDEREPSPEREVSPKFVFGQKKYGRRSRPESTDQESGGQDENIEDADCDAFLPTDNCEKDFKNKSCSRILIEEKKNRSDIVVTPDSVSSVVLEKEDMESPRGQGEAELRAASIRLGVGADGYLDQSELALVCRAVGMEKIADEVVNQVFAKLDVDGVGSISFEEFLQLFRSGSPPSPSHLALSPLSQSFHQPNLTSLEINQSGYVGTDNVIELWEIAGITDANRLLHDLGLSGTSEVNLSLLSSVLDEEIRNIRAESAKNSPVYTGVNYHASLLTAALTLAHAQLKHSRSGLEQMTCERDKLRTDLAEANQRASLLAQEVDDRHARMERASQMQMKLLEQRHSDQVKQLGLQLAADREQLTLVTQRLEKKLTQQQEEETRVRASLTSLQREYEIMEKENRSLSDRLCESEAAKTKAEKEISRVETLQQRVNELESNSDQVASLIEKLSQLQAENTSLRDRNDELSIQVETLSTRMPQKKPGSSISLEGCIGGGTKRRGNSPLGSPPDHCWDDDSPRLGKVRRCCTENDLSLDNVHLEGLAIRPLRHSESGLEADLDTLDDSLTLSNSSSDKINFKLGSESSILYDELERLRTKNAELERTVTQIQMMGMCEYQGTSTSDDEDSGLARNRLKCEMKQVFDVIRRQAIDELSGGFDDIDGRHDDSTSSTISVTPTMPTMSTEMEVQTSLENPNEVIKLEKHCLELKTTLEKVKEEIVKILSEKRECTEENCLLKQRVEDLMKRLSCAKSKSLESPNFNDGILWESELIVPVDHFKSSEESLSIETMQTELSDPCVASPKNSALTCFPFMNREVTVEGKSYTLFPSDTPKTDLKFQNLSQFAFELSQSLNDSDTEQKDFTILESKRLPLCIKFDNDGNSNVCEVKEEPRKKMSVNESTDGESIVVIDGEEGLHCVRSESECVRFKEESLKLVEKCNELETSLELMRVEYEKCEDYWQSKLNEERAIFDQEQRLNDEKFTDLELKIQEYAELFGAEQRKQDGRLPTIDEREMLEKQVTDLEEEFEAFRRAAEEESEERERELNRLRSEVNSLMQTSTNSSTERRDVGVQNDSQDSDTTSRETSSEKQSLPSNNIVGKPGVPVIEVSTPDSEECCCACHKNSEQRMRKGMIKLRDFRTKLQTECDILIQRRDVIVRQLSELQHRGSVIYPAERRTSVDVQMFHNLSARLRHQELRCRHLQSALKHQQRQTEKILQSSWEQHRADLAGVQSTLRLTQDKLQQHTEASKVQLERLALSDILVKELYVENAQLVASVQKLEQRCHYLAERATASSSL